MIAADIVVHDNAAEALYQAVLPELMTTTRTKITAQHRKGNIRFRIESKDATSFRAGINAIIQAISVFEKMKTVKANG